MAIIAEWDGHKIRVMNPEHLAAIALTVGLPKDRARLVYLVEPPTSIAQDSAKSCVETP